MYLFGGEIAEFEIFRRFQETSFWKGFVTFIYHYNSVDGEQVEFYKEIYASHHALVFIQD
jgi:hypothetical protein